MKNVIIPKEQWAKQVTESDQPPAGWIWDGFVAQGNLTILTSQWKSGKTTLISMLLARRHNPFPLAGLPVKPGKTLIVTEEHPRLWLERMKRYEFGNKVCFITRPFRAIPQPEEWHALIDRILALQGQHDIDLLVIDPLAPFLRAENSAGAVLEALLPLQQLTDRGMAVLALHHPGKKERLIGQAARGSGALLAHADVIMEMRHPGGDPHTRRRRFLSLSRHSQTPARLLLEMNADATDYLPVSETEAADDFPSKWEVLRMVLEDAPQKLTRRDILLEWPEDFDQPDPVTLARWLNRAVAKEWVQREGTGRKTDPFRFWLLEKIAEWREKNVCWDAVEKMPFQPLHRKESKRGSEIEVDLD
jgi:archaellum biogenesis ATPase FlaH